MKEIILSMHEIGYRGYKINITHSVVRRMEHLSKTRNLKIVIYSNYNLIFIKDDHGI